MEIEGRKEERLKEDRKERTRRKEKEGRGGDRNGGTCREEGKDGGMRRLKEGKERGVQSG